MSIVYDVQDSMEVQLSKEGLRISEEQLMAMLSRRSRLARDLYSKPITEAAFNRAKAEEETIKLVASYNVSVESLLESYVLELNKLRQEMKLLKEENSDLKLALLTKSELSSTLIDLMLTRG